MTVLRNLLSLVLLVLAGGLAVTGSVARWADGVANTPAPVQEIVGPLSTNPQVQRAVSAALTDTITDQIPTIAGAVPGLHARLEKLIGEAVTATLADPSVDAAWRESLELTRQDLLADIEAYAADPSEVPTIHLDLSPFADAAKVKMAGLTSDPRVQVFIAELNFGRDLSVAVGRPDAAQLDMVVFGIECASQWLWFYVGAGVLAGAGLVAGTRTGRWACLLVAAGLSALAVASIRFAGAFTPAPGGTGLTSTLASTVMVNTSASLASWLTTALYGSLVVALIAVVGIVLTAVRRPRA